MPTVFYLLYECSHAHSYLLCKENFGYKRIKSIHSIILNRTDSEVYLRVTFRWMSAVEHIYRTAFGEQQITMKGPKCVEN